jgi:hypothetical protein
MKGQERWEVVFTASVAFACTFFFLKKARRGQGQNRCPARNLQNIRRNYKMVASPGRSGQGAKNVGVTRQS